MDLDDKAIPSKRKGISMKNCRKSQSIRNLPRDVSKKFEHIFGPRLYQYFGLIRPWSTIEVTTNKYLCTLWGKAFPNQPALDGAETSIELIRAVQNKVEGHLANWRTKMTSAALDFITNMVFRDITTDEE
ncbi:hypothetical protein H0H81_012773 [Sphagnurus paluster]|uniref:Uncharacterized protein n=1 Tax=Sphagnurus paluster TaxID=117069 RepID=A0A9P7FRM3_9AGAR|nr:hypothetical protein H0H81_012773 [Sphagnurus paluster]